MSLPVHASLCMCVSFPTAQIGGHGNARLQGHAHDKYQIVSDKECIHLHFPKVWIVSRGHPIILLTLCYSDG